jgi:hypothetical protein
MILEPWKHKTGVCFIYQDAYHLYFLIIKFELLLQTLDKLSTVYVSFIVVKD